MRLLLMGFAVLTLSSCTGLVQHSMFGSEEGGYVTISGDAEGMRSLSDWNTGLITEGKTSPDVKSAYYQLREGQEIEKTKRFGLKWGPKKGGK